jgi:hypothetical protein
MVGAEEAPPPQSCAPPAVVLIWRGPVAMQSSKMVPSAESPSMRWRALTSVGEAALGQVRVPVV